MVARRKLGQDHHTAPPLSELFASYDRVALVFQGGGALGSYQAGVFNALDEAGCAPNWLSGVSIGAINASIVAGNRPENRLPRLTEFWETISARTLLNHAPAGDGMRQLFNQTSAMFTMALGQPGFFRPRMPSAMFHPPGSEGATSHYDTSPLKATLERLIDFDILNNGSTRLSVGAVNVQTGNFNYFDTAKETIRAEHIMASGALPPAFPAIRIDGQYYWDGGIVSNTPLQYLLEQEDHLNSLVFQVDLFSALGPLPRDMRDVAGRQKDIMYSSRTRQNTDAARKVYALNLKLAKALERIPADRRTPEESEMLEDLRQLGAINIIHLIYQQKIYEGDAKDFEFSSGTMREHWRQGYEDTNRTLKHRQWLRRPAAGEGITVHDLHRDDS